MTEPTQNRDNGRDAGGRFAKGNAGGPGNPHAKRVGQLRAMLLAAVGDDEWRAIVAKLVKLAKAGERWAVEELFDRVLGRPTEADLLDRLAALEELLQESKR